MTAITSERAEEILAGLNEYDLDGAYEWARVQDEVCATRGFLSPRRPEVELTDGTLMVWSPDVGQWVFALPVSAQDPTDETVLTDLLHLRASGAPAWVRLHVSIPTLTIQLRLPQPTDVAAWVKAMGSTAEVGPESFPESGILFHRADVRDWRPGWTVYLACREDLLPSQLQAEVAG